MIRVVCDCGRVFQAEDRHSGKRTRCPVCGSNLVIGPTPTSGSGERDLAEVPSWWFPSDSPGAAGAEPAGAGGGGDAEGVPTAILEPGLDLTGGLRDEGRRAEAMPAGAGRSLRPLAGALAATAAVLALGALGWFWRGSLVPDHAMPPRAGAAPREADRAPGSALSPDRKTSPLVDGPKAQGPEAGRPGRPARRLRLLVPAYIYPSKDGRLQWRRLLDAAAKVDLVAVVNPETGPGAERNPDYAAVVVEAAERGVKLVGYISTQYGARPASEVKADVDTWLRFYPRIAGFFLDQQPPDARHTAHIADIGAYIHEKMKDALVVTNPGTACDESYLARRASDVACIFDNFDGFPAFELPAHLRAYESARYAALVYQVADENTMASLLKEAIIKRIGWIYITDGKTPNPWNRLPAYWEAEVDAVMRLQ